MASRAQWRIVGDSDTTWRNSGEERPDLPGKLSRGMQTGGRQKHPAPVNVLVAEGETSRHTHLFPGQRPEPQPAGGGAIRDGLD